MREGGRWREDEDGNVTEVSKRKAASFINGAYITSLAHGAPNLEELEINITGVPVCELQIVRTCFCLSVSCIIYSRPKASALSKHLNLKRLYIYEGPDWLQDAQREKLEGIQKIAQYSSLESITTTRTTNHSCPWICLEIQRSLGGDFRLIEGPWHGRMIGWEDAVFPGLLGMDC
jgi:hypothetical protein